MATTFRCDRLLTPRETFTPGELRTSAGKVVSAGAPSRDAGAVVDLAGTVVPGLVDIQINGLRRWPVLGATPDDIAAIGAALLAEGVTAWCPTIVSAPEPDRLTSLDAIFEAVRRVGTVDAAPSRRSEAEAQTSRVLGVHLEGPWISRVRKGAHNENAL